MLMETVTSILIHLKPVFYPNNPAELAPKVFYPPVNVTLKLSRSSGKAKGDEVTTADMPEGSGKGNQTT